MILMGLSLSAVAVNFIKQKGTEMEKRKNSRQKGAAGERELAGRLRDYGYVARRGQQFCGANGDADVVGLPGIHIECKRVEKLNLYDAMEQSKKDGRAGEIPVVMHRKNNHEWLVTMTLDYWMKLFQEWHKAL